MNNKQEAIKKYICPICGNTDVHSIGYLNGKPYYHRCISFREKEAGKLMVQIDLVKGVLESLNTRKTQQERGYV